MSNQQVIKFYTFFFRESTHRSFKLLRYNCFPVSTKVLSINVLIFIVFLYKVETLFIIKSFTYTLFYNLNLVFLTGLQENIGRLDIDFELYFHDFFSLSKSYYTISSSLLVLKYRGGEHCRKTLAERLEVQSNKLNIKL